MDPDTTLYTISIITINENIKNQDTKIYHIITKEKQTRKQKKNQFKF